MLQIWEMLAFPKAQCSSLKRTLPKKIFFKKEKNKILKHHYTHFELQFSCAKKLNDIWSVTLPADCAFDSLLLTVVSVLLSPSEGNKTGDKMCLK